MGFLESTRKLSVLFFLTFLVVAAVLFCCNLYITTELPNLSGHRSNYILKSFERTLGVQNNVYTGQGIFLEGFDKRNRTHLVSSYGAGLWKATSKKGLEDSKIEEIKSDSIKTSIATNVTEKKTLEHYNSKILTSNNMQLEKLSLTPRKENIIGSRDDYKTANEPNRVSVQPLNSFIASLPKPPGAPYSLIDWTDDLNDLFVDSNVLDEPPDSDFDPVLSEMMNYYGPYEKVCWENPDILQTVQDAKEIFEFWVHIAKQAKIPYMIFHGSLLGYARHQSVTPYDYDVDVALPTWAFNKLLPYTYPIPLPNEAPRTILVLHPEFSTEGVPFRSSKNCQGKSDFWDRCSHRALMGRVYHKSIYMDLYATDHIPDANLVISRVDDVLLLKPEHLFPRRPCTFLGISTFCPNNHRILVKEFYGIPEMQSSQQPSTSEFINTLLQLLPNRVCSASGRFVKLVETNRDSLLWKPWKDKWKTEIITQVNSNSDDDTKQLDVHSNKNISSSRGFIEFSIPVLEEKAKHSVRYMSYMNFCRHLTVEWNQTKFTDCRNYSIGKSSFY